MKQIQEFLWFFAGADKEVLQGEGLSRERDKYAWIGGFILCSLLLVFVIIWIVFADMEYLGWLFPFLFSLVYAYFYQITHRHLVFRTRKIKFAVSLFVYFILIGSVARFNILNTLVTPFFMVFVLFSIIILTMILREDKYQIILLMKQIKTDLDFSNIQQEIIIQQVKLEEVDNLRRNIFQSGMKSAFNMIYNDVVTIAPKPINGYESDKKAIENTWKNVIGDLNNSFEKLKTEISNEQYQTV
jgi:hypothetical protein